MDGEQNLLLCARPESPYSELGQGARIRLGALDSVLVLSYSAPNMDPAVTTLVRARLTRQMLVWRSRSAV